MCCYDERAKAFNSLFVSSKMVYTVLGTILKTLLSCAFDFSLSATA